MNASQFFRLIRPRTLTAAFSPVILGASFGATHFTSPNPLWLNMIYTICIFICVLCAQMSANIWNEYFDFKSGLDLNQKIGNSGSIVREGLSPLTIKKLGYVTTIIPFILGIILSALITWWYIPAGVICILTSILYSGGPKPISRTPFGELASGLAMGFAIVLITAYAWTETLHARFLIAAIPSTILIGNIMMTNNLRDFANDAAHGRKTLAIVMGRDNGIKFLRNMSILSILWVIIAMALHWVPYSSILVVLAIFPALKAANILKTYADPLKTNEAMKFSAMTCTLYHVLFAIGLLINYQ